MASRAEALPMDQDGTRVLAGRVWECEWSIPLPSHASSGDSRAWRKNSKMHGVSKNVVVANDVWSTLACGGMMTQLV